ncbi:uncharacterized protein LOC133178630 [Saccostrea echinata]|uniref:uncharacterized protein LOC133178630 n=1 Tax=Saccostrea echinata TaxID=191078 RepID=UPI002A815847|nr:uncharacterized protein LOC133178630 [Saccostrea echinata]
MKPPSVAQFMYVFLFRNTNPEVIITHFSYRGSVPETAQACVINNFTLSNGSGHLCAPYCHNDFLCNAFDICFTKGQHVCRLRYGKMEVFPHSTSDCAYFEVVPELSCPEGFFLRSRGVCKNNNLALKSPVIMSSVFDDPDYADFRHGDGSFAVNGEVRSDDKECAHTNEESQPWLTVDLLDQFYVRRVVFVNRKIWEGRLHDLNVTVGTTNMAFICFCGFFIGPGTSHQRVDMACEENCRGRYVRLQITTPVPEFLQLCEIEVYSDCNI